MQHRMLIRAYDFLNRMSFTRQKKETFTVFTGLPSVPKGSGNLFFFCFSNVRSLPHCQHYLPLFPHLTEAAPIPLDQARAHVPGLVCQCLTLTWP